MVGRARKTRGAYADKFHGKPAPSGGSAPWRVAARDKAGLSGRHRTRASRRRSMFQGSLVATITPFRNGAVDERGFQNFIAWQIEQGTHGLVPCGTTGESPTLSHKEHKRVVELCLDVAKGKVPVIAGAGSNSTAEAIELTRHAKEAGADAALIVTPYYNKPTQERLYQHFKAIHDTVDLPTI